jgi:2-phosphosulfolactate phosphatase
MHKSRYARNLAIGAFVNVSAVVEFMKEVKGDFLIICAGRVNATANFSLEDAVCAGMMIRRLQEETSIELELTDSARASLLLYGRLGRSILKMLKMSEHGQYLTEIGFGDDLKVCAAVDTVPALPVLSGTVIKLKKEEQRPVEREQPADDKPSV